jgi:hypothetical protein
MHNPSITFSHREACEKGKREARERERARPITREEKGQEESDKGGPQHKP